MTTLPPEISPQDEIAIMWEVGEDGAIVTASLGDARIIVETTEDAAPMVPWLVASLPSILDAAWVAIEQSQEEE